ncbi:pali-domain-containing protein [Moesziomyces antarcticus]|uniref:Pali-domain-containing protein n=2 Tax=Pseudozyma antarctica TaxID=84753 RepID=A0A081CG20_PSEA2|nr:pali-domain-containing protein [Moesziomyces antarcticus]GAK65616.1 pali-domain-containing protein [Moesziomyces antarcticus]SPO46631.1 uncharacterized protein PSANT_04317 [Moesziomyces antarcticus]
MTRRYLFPALAVSFVSMVLLVLVTISTPTTLSDSTPFDFVRSSRLDGIVDLSPGSNDKRPLGALKFGTWGYCSALNGTDNYACFKHSHGYSATFGINPNTTATAARDSVTIGASWTRGLAVHVVAFVAAIAGLVLTAIPKQPVRLAATVVNAVAALLALIAFCIDIALFVYVQKQMKKVADSPKSMPGPAFYMALIAIPIAIIATALTFLNWRSEGLDKVVTSGYDYPAQTEWNSHQMQPTTTSTEHTQGASSASAQKVLDAYEESKN